MPSRHQSFFLIWICDFYVIWMLISSINTVNHFLVLGHQQQVNKKLYMQPDLLSMKDQQDKRPQSRQLMDFSTCHIISTTYYPSALEKIWVADVAQWAHKAITQDQFCLHLSAHMNEIVHIASIVNKLMNASAFHPARVRGSRKKSEVKLLSHFHYKLDCGLMGEKTFTSAIQPLIGSLRHPFFPCRESLGRLEDKSYMLLANAFDPPYRFLSKSSEKPKVFIFDLGASTYIEGLGGASQQWFVDTLKNQGFTVDEYYGWEVTQMADAKIFNSVPKILLPHYHYFNIPAPTDVNDLANPLNIIKTLCKPDDYVVLKVDIDNSKVELEFVNQLLVDPVLHSLVDEFFFEHHVNFQPMLKYWQTNKETMQLSDSYEIFGALRKHGIRAHGWV